MINKLILICLTVFGCIFLFSGTSLPMFSEETEEGGAAVEDVSEINLEDLLNVEITSASKFSQKLNEAPSVVSVVTREQIKDYGWLSLNDILYQQPGFFPSKDYDRNTVGSRGLFEGWNNNHLLMLVDGVPFNDNLYGSAYTWENTPLFFVKSLEIIRGPGSALYGSNATNGVVSINTLSAEDMKKSSYAQFRGGTLNTQRYDIVAGGMNRAFSYVMGFNAYRSDGNEYMSYDGSSRFDENGNPRQFKVKDGQASNYFFGKISTEQGIKGLSLQFHHQAWNFETGHGWLWMIPDYDESMKESRLLLSLSYKPESESKFSQEYIIRYQRHTIDWNMMMYPIGAFDNFYPAGTWEYLKTDAEDIFARIQMSYHLDKGASILGGVEGTLFLYNGDDEHYSNTDLNDEGGFYMDNGMWVPPYEMYFAPFPNNSMSPMGPWFEWVFDKPVKNIAIYGQFASGELLNKKLRATAGLRFDNQFFNFYALDKEGKPIESKSFSQFSPRIGLVYLVNKNVSVKALAGRAFRAPSPTEMFGANSWTLGSNIRELEPEIITTFELALDWRINKNLNLRLNGFHTKFENQIAYSLQNNNLSTNIYTLTNAGLESELIFGFGKVTGFVNYSFTKRINEEIYDEYIIENDDTVTWAPAHTFNFAVAYSNKKFTASLKGHYQGKVNRRTSDYVYFVTDSPLERDFYVKAWIAIDAKMTYELSKNFEVSLMATNLLDSTNYLIKNFPFPFDYQMMGRRVFGSIRIKL